MITALTPEGLIQERVDAFRRQDFTAIFQSYHPDAPFLQFFPDCDAYLIYAAAELADTFQITDCQILRSCQQGEATEVLFCQRLIYKGEVCDSLEIARCHSNEDGQWSFVAGLRLDPLKLPDDLLHASWDKLLAAGNDLWI